MIKDQLKEKVPVILWVTHVRNKFL